VQSDQLLSASTHFDGFRAAGADEIVTYGQHSRSERRTGGGMAGIIERPWRRDDLAGVKTAIALWGDRHIPATVIAQQARALESGGVDGMLIADQFGNFIPPQLWKPEITPAAALLPDPDSHSDPFTLAGYLLAASAHPRRRRVNGLGAARSKRAGPGGAYARQT